MTIDDYQVDGWTLSYETKPHATNQDMTLFYTSRSFPDLRVPIPTTVAAMTKTTHHRWLLHAIHETLQKALDMYCAWLEGV